MKKLLLSFVLLMTLFTGNAQKMDFFKEDLSFSLSDSLFEVDGLYYFRNLTPAALNQLLFYPFPDTEKYGDIVYIKINMEGDTVSQLATQTKAGSLFKVSIPPSNEAVYRIRYGQRFKTNEATYIILTTRQWQKPFETADYSLEVSEDLRIDHFSIEPDTLLIIDDSILYRWHRDNFMPEVDFEFRFSRVAK